MSMIAGLSDFLRRLLEDTTRQQVPLGEEVELAQKYLGIQKVRFVERLQFSVDVPTDLLPAQVPTLILQLLVENAIKHGITKRAPGGAIRIAASRSDGRLSVSVYDDEPPAVKWENMQSGIGMANIRRPPQEPLRRCVRPEHAQSGSRRRASNCLCSVQGVIVFAERHPGKIRAVIVDDEPLARASLSVLLRPDPEIEIVGECGSGVEAPEEIRRTKPDLLFLDVHMPECDGFDVLELLGKDVPPAVVFVTAYDQYALRAFEAGALATS